MWRKYAPEVKSAKGLKRCGQKSRGLTTPPESPVISQYTRVFGCVCVCKSPPLTRLNRLLVNIHVCSGAFVCVSVCERERGERERERERERRL